MKVLLFDMDGTLVDSMGRWIGVEREYFESKGVSYDMVDQEMLTIGGLVPVFNVLRKNYGFELSLAEAREFMHERMDDFYSNDVELLPGVARVLEEFKNLGVRMAVGTATQEKLAKKSLKHTGIRDYFEFLYSSSIDGYNKNNQRFFIKTADHFGVEPEDQILFDDSIYALVTAVETGLYTVGILDSREKDAHEKEDHIKRITDETIWGFKDFDPESWARDHDLID